MTTTKITRGYLLSLIDDVKYTHRKQKTICTLTVNGYEIIGESFCPDETQYVESLGEKIAYENALRKLHSHEMYALVAKG
jgi:hypothetical protein